MNKKIGILLNLVIASLSLVSFGNTSNDNIYFHPVAEIHVDELPESIMDLKFIHSVCKIPIVFRGAAKHWESMTWTPESLKKKGLREIEEVMKSSDSSERLGIKLWVTFHGNDTSASSSQLTEIVKDMHYHDTLIRPENPNRMNSYELYLLAGSGSFRMDRFHAHGSVLLSEFYGERMVFLAEPGWGDGDKDMIKLVKESNRIAQIASKNPLDPLLDINNGDYSRLQQVILKPGDILYIPGGWSHKVNYLTPCIGATQLVYTKKRSYS